MVIMTSEIRKEERRLQDPDELRQTRVELTKATKGHGDRGWITIQVLNRIREGIPTPELLKEVVNLLAWWSGFEAVGLRLKDGDDYPYFQTRGMREEFIRLENSLCPQGHDAKPEGAGNGDIVLECACGSVLQGRVDRSLPFITEYGSLWTNSNTQLLNERPELRDAIRGNCVRAGYETSALIPLRFGDQTFGLLQFEDKRAGMLSEELLSTLESISVNLSLTLSQRQYAEDLRREKNTLERRVLERTTELSEVNSALLQVIEDKEKVEASLRESEERFRVMANSIPQLAWIARADGYISWYNQRWYEYTGTTPEEMEGWGWQSVHDPDALPGVLEGWKASIDTGMPFDMVFPLRGVDGSFRQFLTRVQPVKNSVGEVIRWCGTNTDITERKEIEEELRKSRDELELRVEERTAEIKTFMGKLEESNQALRDFASIAAHDLQEPLRKVSTFGNMLKRKCGDLIGEDGNSYLDRVIDANQRMQSLLTALLEYSRLTTRADPFTEVDLEKVVHEVLSDLEVRIEKPGGEVQVGDIPVIQADPTQMRQLFQNLIGNALKFHRKGEKPVIKVSSSAAGNGHFQIMVEDNGIGFEEQYTDRIFAPFQRLHGKGGPYEGTGMGLAICKKIVERHGGSITAKSTPGMGSTFVITLPPDTKRKNRHQSR
jgi:PAS domain S-box-containing protein